jgi:hypothetical protein
VSDSRRLCSKKKGGEKPNDSFRTRGVWRLCERLSGKEENYRGGSLCGEMQSKEQT